MVKFAFKFLILTLSVYTTYAHILPRYSFSGPYGGTAGAGSVVGWERQDFESNPAAMSVQQYGFWVSGFSPFGLENMGFWEAGLRLDGKRLGGSMALQGAILPNGNSTWNWQAQQSIKFTSEFSSGITLRIQQEKNVSTSSTDMFSTRLGTKWDPFSFLSMGAWLGIPSSNIHNYEVGLGSDFGVAFQGQMGIRVCTELLGNSKEWAPRFGTQFNLHPALAIHAGWFPKTLTWALGIRFSMGKWNGYHALRRHVYLGSTSLQGLQWAGVKQ